jgi:Na+-driven multidrug efflux pump
MRKTVSSDMTSGDLRRQIITFAFPIFLGNLFQLFYNTADSFIVGNYVGAEALADVSSTSALISILVGFFQGFSVGAGIVTARNIGKHDEEEVQKSVHTSAAMGLALTVLISILGVLISEPIMKLMNTPSDILNDAVTYLSIYFAGAVGLIMYNMFVSTLQASGDSRNPLYYLIISSLLNIVLDIVFIRNFHLGVAGAAYATA